MTSLPPSDVYRPWDERDVRASRRHELEKLQRDNFALRAMIGDHVHLVEGNGRVFCSKQQPCAGTTRVVVPSR